jgi:hypothetical protein
MQDRRFAPGPSVILVEAGREALLVLGDIGQKYLAERNLPLRSISHLPNEIWEPRDCPLCASQVLLTQLD